MSPSPLWLRGRLVFVFLALLLLVLVISSTTISSYHLPYRGQSLKDTYGSIKDIIVHGPEAAAFYRGKTSRWQETYPNRPNLTSCNYNFCKPIPALSLRPPPSTFKCPRFELNGTNPLVIIGVFSNAEGGIVEKHRRELWRLTGKEGVPYHLRYLIDIRFVLGRSEDKQQEKDLDEEEGIYEDLIRIDGLVNGDNIDDGKTYMYFRHIYEETKHDQDRRPVFVMKTDVDSFLVLPNILDDLYSFSSICASENAAAYWGTRWGSWMGDVIPLYFRGLGYIISYPLVAWIASTPEPLPYENIRDAEDVRTGAWLWWLPDGYKLWVKDEVTDAQDWDSNTVTFSPKVTIVHALKTLQLWTEYATRIRSLWYKAGREYMWDPKLSHRDIIHSSD